jgi:hypothetical protein
MSEEFRIVTVEGGKATVWMTVKGDGVPVKLLEYFEKTTLDFLVVRVRDGRAIPLLKLLELARKRGANEDTLII